MTHGSIIQRIATNLAAIGGRTFVMFELIVSLGTISRLKLLFAKLRENSVLIPMFFSLANFEARGIRTALDIDSGFSIYRDDGFAR